MHNAQMRMMSMEKLGVHALHNEYKVYLEILKNLFSITNMTAFLKVAPRLMEARNINFWSYGCMPKLQEENVANEIKKDNKIFLTHKEIQNGEVAKSYMTNGLRIYG